VKIQRSAKACLVEEARYFPVPGAHLYTVLHQATEPLARVLLIGPLASERHFAYHPWIRWARYLAAHRIEVLRFDYRGVGESTGVFEEMSFENWSEDVHLLGEWIAGQTPRVPLLLHGLEVGAILAARSFNQGLGDALLLWSPPANANLALRSSLLQWAGLEQLYESPRNRRPASEFIRRLEEDSCIEVQGYLWSGRLWRDSFMWALPGTMKEGSSHDEMSNRPVKISMLSRDAAPLVKPHLMYDELKDISWLYSDNFEWVAEALQLPDRGRNGSGD